MSITQGEWLKTWRAAIQNDLAQTKTAITSYLGPEKTKELWDYLNGGFSGNQHEAELNAIIKQVNDKVFPSLAWDGNQYKLCLLAMVQNGFKTEPGQQALMLKHVRDHAATIGGWDKFWPKGHAAPADSKESTTLLDDKSKQESDSCSCKCTVM